MDIITDYRARKMHRDGASFRDIADHAGASLSRVRKSLRDAPGGRMRRDMRQEIRVAGGLRAWWDGA
ncbi:MAG: hypothetical protein ACRDTS_16620 [Mycobacterium sp.]